MKIDLEFKDGTDMRSQTVQSGSFLFGAGRVTITLDIATLPVEIDVNNLKKVTIHYGDD